MRGNWFAAVTSVAIVWAAPAAAAVPPDFKARADALLAESFAADGPGVAVIVMDDGKIAYTAGRGLADVAARRQITPDTVFRLGSVTKQFTSAVILQLAEEGKLSLSDPLSKFLPDYPRPGADVTVTQLLNHTSGIQSYTGIPGWMQGDKPAQAVTTESLIAEFRGFPQQFPAGTRYAYNNSGYVLLGAIIEKVTGKPWYQAIDERIVKPLGLTSIRYGVGESSVPAMAVGYSREEGKVGPSRPIHMSVPHAAGALIGSVGDLAKWANALHHGKVVKSESYRQMIARTRLVGGEEVSYAFGLDNGDIRGHRTISHGGGIFGFSTGSLYVPEEDVFVAVFANSDAPQTSNQVVTLRLAGLAINDPFPSFTRAQPPATELEPLLGIYKAEKNQQTLLARDGKLFIRGTAGNDAEVQAAGGDRFFFPNGLTWFSIARDGAGKHVMTFYQGGAKTGQTSVWSGPVPADAPVANVPRDVLARYTGRYQLNGAPVQVAMGEDGRLTVKLGPQPALPIIPTSATEFRVETVNARVTFHEKEGAVTHLTIDQGGRQTDAQRVAGE